MVPNYCQGLGLGGDFGAAVDTFALVPDGDRWALDLDELDRAVGRRPGRSWSATRTTRPAPSCTEGEMEAVIEVADARARGSSPTRSTAARKWTRTRRSPTFWGRCDRVVVTSGLSKAFGDAGAPHRMGRRADQARSSGSGGTTTTRPSRPACSATGSLRSAMQPAGPRAASSRRTRAIIRANLPPARSVVRRAARASATAGRPRERSRSPQPTCRSRHESSSSASERSSPCSWCRARCSAVDNGIRIGFGYEIDDTMEGLALVGKTLASFGSP